MGITPQLTVIELVVEDMAKSLAFYRRLGLDIAPDADGEPHVEAELAGGLRLAFDTVETIRSFEPEWTAPHGGHRIALAFHCATAGNVDAVYQDIIGAGYGGRLAPFDAPWGQRYAIVTDPDGNAVDLFAPTTTGDAGQDA